MKQSELIVGHEVAIRGYSGPWRRAKVKALGVRRPFSSRKDGVEVEFLESPGVTFPKPGDIKTVQSRDIEMTWGEAKPLVAARIKKQEDSAALEAAAATRMTDIDLRVKDAVGIGSFPEVSRHGRELERDQANRAIRQPEGDRMLIDTKAVEALLQKIESADEP